MPALRMAYSGMDNINKNIQDYTCMLVKRERIDGKLGDYQYMAVKIRNHPFSVYLGFLKPEEVAGREVIYVDGANKNELQAHEGKGLERSIGHVLVQSRPAPSRWKATAIRSRKSASPT